MQLEAKYGVVQDYALQERVNRIGQSLVKVSERVTFVIDEQGRVAHVISDPSCPDHGEEVLGLL